MCFPNTSKLEMKTPVLTDRHDFLLYKGNTVEKIADNSHFVYQCSHWYTLPSRVQLYVCCMRYKEGCRMCVCQACVKLK